MKQNKTPGEAVNICLRSDFMYVKPKAQATKAEIEKQDDFKGLNCLPKKTLKTCLHRSKANGYQIPSWGGGRNWELGINIYIDTSIYNIDNQQRLTTKPQASLLEIL